MAGLPKMQMERRGGALYPIDPWSEERLYGYAEKTPLDIVATNAKRKNKLGLYWAGLGTLQHNLSEEQDKLWPTQRALHGMLMLEVGVTLIQYRQDQTYFFIPDSIAINNMGDDDFDIVFERVRQVVNDLFGWDPWDIWIAEAKRKRAQEQLDREARRLPPTTKPVPYKED